MGESDGGVLLNVQLSPDDAAKEFEKLSKKAVGLEDKLAQGKAQLKAATDEAAKLGAQLDAVKAKQAQMEASGTATADQLKIQAETVTSLQARYNAADQKAQRMTQAVEKTNTELTATREKAAQVAKEMGKGGAGLGQMGIYAEKLENRLKQLASRVLIFSVITSGLRSLRSWFSDVIKTDKDAVAAIAQLKGALLTLVQPLVSVVIPAFTAFVQVLAQVVGALASVVSSIFGTTVEESAAAAENLNDEKKALDGVGASAKKAGKSLASFDEINKLSGDTAGGSAGSKATEIAPDFSFLDGATERLQEIAKLVMLIGAGFALWKIGSELGGVLGDIASKLGGALLVTAGVTLLIDNIQAILSGEYENTSPESFVKTILGGALIGLGFVAMGATGWAIPIAIGLSFAITDIVVNWDSIKGMWSHILDGLKALFTGDATTFWEEISQAYLTWMNMDSWTVKIAKAITDAIFGEGTWENAKKFLEEGGTIDQLFSEAASRIAENLSKPFLSIIENIDGAKEILQGFSDFFGGIFSGNIEQAMQGITKIFDGLGLSVSQVIDGIKTVFFGFLDWLDEKTGGQFHDTIENIKGLFSGITKFISGVFTQDWDLAWEGVKDIFGESFVNGILGFFTSGVNLIIKAINFVIGKLNGLSFDVPDWVPGIGGKSLGFSIPKIQEYEIPKLAAGKVIPPNREFVAVLGDQTHGNNLEGPESLFRQIVREESGAGGDISGVMSILQQILAAIKEGKIMMVDDDVFARVIHEASERENSRQGMALVTMG